MCSNPLNAEGAWPRQIWGGENCGGWHFKACKQRVSGGEETSARFSLPTTTVQWDPSKITLNSPFPNLFLTEIEFHGNFVFVHLSLQVSPVIFFAANFAGTNFSPAPFVSGTFFLPH